MSNQYVGEIRMFGGNFAPVGWMFCQGQLLSISEYAVLFDLIGTTYGGDGQSTFALPDLRSRFPMHVGAGYVLGQIGGEESVTLTANQIPAHRHQLTGSSVASATSPAGATPAVSSLSQYATTTATPTDELLPTAIATTGGSQPHENLSPYLGLNFIIAFTGIFPSAG